MTTTAFRRPTARSALCVSAEHIHTDTQKHTHGTLKQKFRETILPLRCPGHAHIVCSILITRVKIQVLAEEQFHNSPTGCHHSLQNTDTKAHTEEGTYETISLSGFEETAFSVLLSASQ